MITNVNIPINAGVIQYLKRTRAAANAEAIALPKSVKDPYLNLGSHPDVVGHVWGALYANLPVDCRFVVYGTPALVHPETGVVLAVALGTQYGLRVPYARFQEALKAGAKLKTQWTYGGELNVQTEFGEDWILGSYSKTSAQWCRETYDSLDEQGQT